MSISLSASLASELPDALKGISILANNYLVGKYMIDRAGLNKAEYDFIKKLDEWRNNNSQQRDRVLISLSSAAIGLGIIYHQDFHSNVDMHIGLVAFILSIFFVLVAFWCFDVLVPVTQYDIVKKLSSSRFSNWLEHVLLTANILASVSFLAGVIFYVRSVF